MLSLETEVFPLKLRVGMWFQGAWSVERDVKLGRNKARQRVRDNRRFESGRRREEWLVQAI